MTTAGDNEFKESIKLGAEAIMVSHILLTSIDKFTPASLSKKVIKEYLNNSMNMIRSTGEQIKNNALKEREVILVDAKNNASRILNDALIKAEKISMESDKVKKDVVIYKNKVRSLIECQLDIIDDIDKIDF